MARFATLEQFEDIVWSWGRVGKGDQEVWECIEKELLRHLQSLKPRQLAFSYYSLCSTAHASPEVLKAIEERFIQLPLEDLNEHYLIKFLLGMHRKRFYDNDKFSKLSEIISAKIEKLSNNEFVNFLRILNESDLDFQSKESISGVIDSI
jgi:hypothetical protein